MTLNSLVHIPSHLYYCIVQGQMVKFLHQQKLWQSYYWIELGGSSILILLLLTELTTPYVYSFLWFFFPASISYFEVLFITRIPLYIYSFLDFLPLFMLIRLFGTQEYSQELHLLVVCVVDRRLGKIHVWKAPLILEMKAISHCYFTRLNPTKKGPF